MKPWTRVKMAAVAAVAFAVICGCSDKGEGLLGAGPDDRTDRGGGPDTISVTASADTYFEKTFNDGSYLLAGELPSAELQAVTFIVFKNLPTPQGELSEAHLVLYVADNRPPYNLRISRLEEPPPSEVPFWPGPPEGSDLVVVSNAETVEDTTASAEGFFYLKIEIPADWIAGWISDPATNYGVRISGGRLDVSGSGEIQRRFWAGGQVIQGVNLSPRLETLKTDQNEPRIWRSTQDFFITNPSLDSPVGDLPYLRLGGNFDYGMLMRFEFGGLSEEASVNKALLRVKIDRSRPDLNEGIFGARAAPIAGEWGEDSLNVDVELESAASEEVEIDAGEGGEDEVVFDVTALVEVFAKGNVFEVGVVRTGAFAFGDQIAVYSSEAPDARDAPVLSIVFTTPPGGRYTP